MTLTSKTSPVHKPCTYPAPSMRIHERGRIYQVRSFILRLCWCKGPHKSWTLTKRGPAWRPLMYTSVLWRWIFFFTSPDLQLLGKIKFNFFSYDKASKKDIAVCQDAKSQVTQVHNKSSCFIHFTWGYATEVQLIFESMNKYALINKIQQLCLISSHGLAQPTQTLRQ